MFCTALPNPVLPTGALDNDRTFGQKYVPRGGKEEIREASGHPLMMAQLVTEDLEEFEAILGGSTLQEMTLEQVAEMGVEIVE